MATQESISVPEVVYGELEQQLRERFERNRPYRRSFQHTFDELQAPFRNLSLSWSEIGKLWGIKVQHVSKLYHRYVEPLERMTGIERFKRRMQTRAEERIREMPDMQRNPALTRVALAAEKAGLTVHQILSEGCPNGLRSWALRIQGHRCLVHRLTRCAPLNGRSDRRYARVQFQRTYAQPYDAHIVSIMVRPRMRILVIPSYVLQRCTGKSSHIAGWIPVEGNTRRITKLTKVDWLKYENAWHLLADEEDE